MGCCCDKILNLCQVPVCGSLVIEQAVGESGESGDVLYSLILDYLQSTVSFAQSQTVGENITFDVSMLNENFEYLGQIFDSAGNLVKITVDGVEYDCIKFKTVMNVVL